MVNECTCVDDGERVVQGMHLCRHAQHHACVFVYGMCAMGCMRQLAEGACGCFLYLCCVTGVEYSRHEMASHREACPMCASHAQEAYSIRVKLTAGQSGIQRGRGQPRQAG